MPARRRAAALGAGPDRTAGLDDWGPPLPDAAPAAVPAETINTPTPEDDPPNPRSTPAAPASATARGTRPISARIPVSLFEAVNAARAQTGQTHEMWFLSALDAVWDRLESEYPPASARPGSKVPVRDRRARRPVGEPLVQYPLRLTAEERAALDDRYRACRPPSMADLVTTVVRLGLHAQTTD